MTRKIYSFLATIIVGCNLCIAQISIDFPTERTVFQRDLSNRGNIYISGSISERVDKIEARLTEYRNGTEVGNSDWQEIDNQSDKGYFQSHIEAKGGWYKMEIRAFVNDEVRFQSTVNKVGVGEVFIISGQSNAQGVPGNGGAGARDDRVNCANFYNVNFDSKPNFSLEFSQLSNDSNIGPMGLTPWVWGEVGDSLASQLDVPILFFNTALSGTLAVNWYESALGNYTFSAIFRNYFKLGFPYQNLKNALQFYASLLGVRAILWHQGETDTFPGVPRFDQVYGYYETLINQSRADFGQNVAWMFSKVSYSNWYTSSIVIDAQTAIINKPNFNIFEGPYTDTLQIPREDGVHFKNTDTVRGLGLLASAWIKQLNLDFFQRCKPILQKPFFQLEINCKDGTLAEMTIPDAFKIYQWADGTTQDTKIANAGDFKAIATDMQGNFKFSNHINLSAIPFDYLPKPLAAKTFICEGDSLLLKTELNQNVWQWSNGSTADSIYIDLAGNYSYSSTNSLGCLLGSDSLEIKKIEMPEKAQKLRFTLNGVNLDNAEVIQFCDGDEQIFSFADDWQAYIWSDGDSSKTKIVSDSKNLMAQAVYAPGCLTTKSSEIAFIANTKPDKPLVLPDGIYQIKVENFNNNELAWFKDDIQLINTEPELKISEGGNYQVQLVKKINEDLSCKSERSDGFFVEISKTETIQTYPNPARHILSLESHGNQTNVKIELFNAQGKLMYRREGIKEWVKRLEIPLTGFSIGNYILCIKSDQTLMRKKINVF